MKIKAKNNGCAEVAYADLFGKVLVLPGESVLDIPDESVKPLITTLKRRAPQVFIEVIVDKPAVPKPPASEKARSKKSKKAKKPADKKPADKKPDNINPPSIDGGEKS